MNKFFLPTISIAIVSLSACTSETVPNSNSEKNTPKMSNVSKNTAAEYVSPLPDDAPVYTVAMTGTSPPFSLRNDNDLLVGIDVDIIRAVGEVEGFKVDFLKSISLVDMFEMAETGKADLALSGISYRVEREKKYALSDPYFFNPVAIAYTNVNLNVKSLQDLKGKKIGGIIDSTSMEFSQQVPNAEIIEQKTPFLAYSSLIRGEIDATIYDHLVLQFYAQQLSEYPTIVQPIEERDEVNNKGAFAVVMSAKNNTDLIEKVNSGLAKIKEQGKLQEIEKKWLAKK